MDRTTAIIEAGTSDMQRSFVLSAPLTAAAKAPTSRVVIGTTRSLFVDEPTCVGEGTQFASFAAVFIRSKDPAQRRLPVADPLCVPNTRPWALTCDDAGRC